MCFGDSLWEVPVIRVTSESQQWLETVIGNTLRKQTLLRDSVLIGMEIWQLSKTEWISSSPNV